jgi:DNA replication protein DnaC
MADRAIRPHMRPRDAKWPGVLRDAEIPERYWTAGLAAITADELRKFGESVTLDPKWLREGFGYYLHGPLCSGKSSFAAILAQDALMRCERVLWLAVRDVPTAMFREGDRGKALSDKLHTADVVVMDDLGAERFRLSSAAGTALEEVIRIVYDRNRSLLVTSNVSWGDFGNVYGSENPPLVSVLQRIVCPVEVKNTQWPRAARG